jgi:phosphate/sulfate permease
MDTGLAALVAIVVIALAFDFTNGFHDATPSRRLSPPER